MIPSPLPECVPERRAATIGTFDGVHLGHRTVLNELSAIAADRALTPAVVTFDRHPLSLMAPERAPRQLLSADWKTRLLRRTGFETIVFPFDARLRTLTAREFMQLLHSRYGVRTLLIGHDNRFGSDARSGSFEIYRTIGSEFGIEVLPAPVAEGISSSAIRCDLREGRMEEANSKLGYKYTLGGIVMPGKQLGRTLGFPTANSVPTDPLKLVPAQGVYAAEALTADGEIFPAMVNIGRRPTVDSKEAPISIEAHLLDFNGDLYGSQLLLRFSRRLRDEKRFDSLNELSAALAVDLEKTRSTVVPDPNSPFIF